MQHVFATRACRLLALLAGALIVAAEAAPKAELWQRWTRHDTAAQRRVDHSAWTGFLAAHLTRGSDGVTRVRYGTVSKPARAILDAYLDMLQSTPVSELDRAGQRALWINLYNALTLRVILDHYPVKSIRDIDISPGLFADGPWGRKLITVEGEALGLDDIEHRILRPIWNDPRIHYAVNCASIGCPDLLPEAFTRENTDRLLDVAARGYVNHPRGVTVDRGKLVVSSIYRWFQEDFGGTDAGVIAHLRRYAHEPLLTVLAPLNRIDDDRYDWALNDASGRAD